MKKKVENLSQKSIDKINDYFSGYSYNNNLTEYETNLSNAFYGVCEATVSSGVFNELEIDFLYALKVKAGHLMISHLKKLENN